MTQAKYLKMTSFIKGLTIFRLLASSDRGMAASDVAQAAGVTHWMFRAYIVAIERAGIRVTILPGRHDGEVLYRIDDIAGVAVKT